MSVLGSNGGDAREVRTPSTRSGLRAPVNRLDATVLFAALAVAMASPLEIRAAEPPRSRPPPLPSAPPPPVVLAACAPLSVPSPELMSVPELDPVPVPDVEHGDALAPFYAMLARSLRGGAKEHVRVGVYGDSNGCQDFFTGEMRRWLQSRYGDAGHGYIALGKPWSWYMHRDVRQGIDAPLWSSYVVSSHPASDPYYGMGLIAGQSALRGAVSWIATADESSVIGKTVSKVDLYFLKWPRGGSFDVMVDGARAETVDSHSPRIEAGFSMLDLPDAPHKIAIIPRGGAPVRLFGATMERGSPSFVIDDLSVGAANWRVMLREDPALDTATLRHRGYDLLVLHMGTNTWTGEPGRADSMRAELARLRAEMPDLPMLVLSSPDHADNGELMDRIVTPEQRQIALEAGAAFWDFHAAMGGLGSMQTFFRNKLAMNDVIHWNEKGGAFMARRFMVALFRDFSRWLAAHPDAGCEAR
jgi:hypothetical protein